MRGREVVGVNGARRRAVNQSERQASSASSSKLSECRGERPRALTRRQTIGLGAEHKEPAGRKAFVSIFILFGMHGHIFFSTIYFMCICSDKEFIYIHIYESNNSL